MSRFRTASVWAAGLILMSALLSGRAGRVLAQAEERELYVSVLDATGAPVKDLTPADFIVKEDGVRREVLRVRPATEPMQIAVLIDNSEAATDAIQYVRTGLSDFVARIHDNNEMALVTFGERPTILVEYTRDLLQLKKGVDRIFARPDSGAYLLDAIIETARGLRQREAARPVILAITTEGPEFSNPHHDLVLESLKASGAALHALVLTSPALQDPMNAETRSRNIVLDSGTTMTGGRRDNLLTSMGLPTRLEQVAAELLSQYRVTYARPPSLIPPEKIEVEAAKPDLTARGTPIPGRKRG